MDSAWCLGHSHHSRALDKAGFQEGAPGSFSIPTASLQLDGSWLITTKHIRQQARRRLLGNTLRLGQSELGHRQAELRAQSPGPLGLSQSHTDLLS